MPTYKVPPELDYGAPVAGDTNKRKKKRQPTVHVPMNPEWLQNMEMGAPVEITLKGKIMGYSAHNDEFGKEHNVRVAVDSVSYYNSKEAKVKEVLDDDDEDE